MGRTLGRKPLDFRIGLWISGSEGVRLRIRDWGSKVRKFRADISRV